MFYSPYTSVHICYFIKIYSYFIQLMLVKPLVYNNDNDNDNDTDNDTDNDNATSWVACDFDIYYCFCLISTALICGLVLALFSYMYTI